MKLFEPIQASSIPEATTLLTFVYLTSWFAFAIVEVFVLPAHWTRLNYSGLEIELLACLAAGELYTRDASSMCWWILELVFLIDKIALRRVRCLSQIERAIFVKK